MQGHSGYNLSDETAVRYGHSFAMAFGVEGAGEDGTMDSQDAVVAMLYRVENARGVSSEWRYG